MSTTVPDTTSSQKEIAQARQDMGEALFHLADRLAPKKVISRMKEQAKVVAAEKVEQLKERVNPARILDRKLHPKRPAIETRGYESERALSR